MTRLLALMALMMPAAAASAETAPPAGSDYVAMGSSYAAGLAIGTKNPDGPARCGRSLDNYAQQLARKRGLRLIDASCSGATTEHILGAWRELPPQLGAVTENTRLVTITIGGNDLDFVKGLYSLWCADTHSGGRGASDQCPAFQPPAASRYGEVEAALRRIAEGVHARARQARVIFVDYVSIVPAHGSCDTLGLTPHDAAIMRTIARKLAAATARAARATGSGLLRASALTRGHDVCAADPWSAGPPNPNGMPNMAAFHPMLPAMTAIAAGLDAMLGK